LDSNNSNNKNELNKDFLIYECNYEPMVKELLDYYSEQVRSIKLIMFIYIKNILLL